MRYFLEPTDPNSEHPCGIYAQYVIDEQHCDTCNHVIHTECGGIDNKTEGAFMESNDEELYFCKICEAEMLTSPKTTLVKLTQL